MYTVRLRRGSGPDRVAVTAEATSLASALGFVREFCGIEFDLLEGGWKEEGGRYVMYVYDWLDCWFADPPVVAEVIAPPGFVPRGSATASP
jgi:hypothetical protein